MTSVRRSRPKPGCRVATSCCTMPILESGIAVPPGEYGRDTRAGGNGLHGGGTDPARTRLGAGAALAAALAGGGTGLGRGDPGWCARFRGSGRAGDVRFPRTLAPAGRRAGVVEGVVDA